MTLDMERRCKELHDKIAKRDERMDMLKRLIASEPVTTNLQVPPVNVNPPIQPKPTEKTPEVEVAEDIPEKHLKN